MRPAGLLDQRRTLFAPSGNCRLSSPSQEGGIETRLAGPNFGVRETSLSDFLTGKEAIAPVQSGHCRLNLPTYPHGNLPLNWEGDEITSLVSFEASHPGHVQPKPWQLPGPRPHGNGPFFARAPGRRYASWSTGWVEHDEMIISRIRVTVIRIILLLVKWIWFKLWKYGFSMNFEQSAHCQSF